MSGLWDEIEKLREVVRDLGPDEDDEAAPGDVWERLEWAYQRSLRQSSRPPTGGRPPLSVIQGGRGG